ncbi:MAG: glycosyltransferase family 2 protein [Gemmataceae bacterium]
MNVPSPTISVVIPCYNGANYLREAIDSVLSQTRPVLEVIVVDDGSTDDSFAIAESYGAPVRVIRQPNQGESVARNRGIDEAKGDWIAFLDADDLWMGDKIERQAAHMSSGCIAICTANENRWQGVAPVSRSIHRPKREAFCVGWVLEHGTPCHISSLVVRRDARARFPPWTQFAEDVVYYLELLTEGRGVAIVDCPLSVYRHHASNQTARPEAGEGRYNTIRTWFEENGGRFPASEHRLLRRAIMRLVQHWLLSRAIAFRQSGRSASSIPLYARVFAISLTTASSCRILASATRGLMGAITESLWLRKHPRLT